MGFINPTIRIGTEVPMSINEDVFISIDKLFSIVGNNIITIIDSD